jgi:phosphatidylglycerol:prolipoprotein diacylglycerol transferase
MADPSRPLKTRLEPFIRVPGSFPYSWITLVIIGMIVALTVQAQLIASAHLPVGRVMWLSLLAMAAGVVGSKMWHYAKHRHEPDTMTGWCIQGFILGTTVTVVPAFLLAHLPLGTVLAASAPGLLFGMAIGRVGCFVAGCCGGPPTAARWGMWSSDTHVGARRVPTQLMESLFCLVLGLVMLAVFHLHGPASGGYFVATLAAYVLFREGLLRLRAEKERAWLPVTVTPIVSGLVLVAAVIVIAVR